MHHLIVNMNLKNTVIALFWLCLMSPVAKAQDVIVRHDGSTIVCKVQKVGISEVEYKKASNLEGPLYVIAKEDILSINYENGERDVFGTKKADAEAVSQPVTEQNPAETNSVTVVPAILPPLKHQTVVEEQEQHVAVAETQNQLKPAMDPETLAKIRNEERLSFYNDMEIAYKSERKQYGTADRLFYSLCFANSSELQNTDLAVAISFGQISFSPTRATGRSATSFSRNFDKGVGCTYFTNQAWQVTLSNNTMNLIYVDLKSSVYRRGKDMESLLVNNAQASNDESPSVMVVPPMGTRTLNAELIFPESHSGTEGVQIEYSVNRNGFYPVTYIGRGRSIRNGALFTYTEQSSPLTFGIKLVYAYDENFSEPKEIKANLYARQVMGFPQPAGATQFGANAEKFIEGSDTPYHIITGLVSGVCKNGYIDFPVSK